MSQHLAWLNHLRNNKQDRWLNDLDAKASLALQTANDALSGGAKITMKDGRAWLENYANPVNNELVTIRFHDDPALEQSGAYRFAAGSIEVADNYYVISHPSGRWFRVTLG